MSRFHDIEEFVRQHGSCGALTPTASEPAMGGYFLTLTCSCGAAFDRWVTEEESKDLPNLVAGSRTPASARESKPPAVQTLTPPTGESFETIMQEALAAVDKAAPAPEPPKPEVSALQAALESTLAELDEPQPPTPPPGRQPRRPAPAPTPVAPRAEPPAVDASAATRPAADPVTSRGAAPIASSAPVAPSAPVPVAPRRPVPPLPREPATPAAPPPAVASADVEEAAATEPTAETRETPMLTVDRGTLEEVMKRALEEVSAPKPGRKRDQPPDKVSLEKALRTALDEYDTETRKLGAPGAPRRRVVAVDLGLPAETPPPRPRRRLTVAGALVIAALLGGVAGLWYATHSRSGTGVVIASAPAKPRLPQDDRTSLIQAMSVLRELQGMSRPDVPYRVYVSRVSFTKADVDRYTQTVKDVEFRGAVQEVLALHALATAAWRAKTLNERERWEAVGDDPTVELCPPAKRLLAVGDEPQGMSRAHWRGIALAAAIPVIWDCAAERIAEADKNLRGR